MIETLDSLAASFAAAGARTTDRGRGVTAGFVDRGASAAKADALSSWSRYGRGEAGSAGTIRARMSRDRSEVVGWMLADGEGVFQAEHGTTSRAPDPVMARAAEAQLDGWADAMADMAADVL